LPSPKKLAARAPGKFALVGLGASGKDPILVARDGAIILGLAGRPIQDSKPNPPKRFSEVSASAFMRDVEKREGRVSHFYYDTTKNITIGVGHKLEKSELGRLRMTWRKDVPPIERRAGQTASGKDVHDEYKRFDRDIKPKITQTTTAADQTRYTALQLASGEADRLLRRDYREHRDPANRDFTLSSLPPDVQMGLLDLYFQRGPNNFRTKFSKMTDAIGRRDWKKAGDESSVSNGTANRNTARKAFFERAARLYPFHRSLTKKRKLLDLLLNSSSL